MTWPTLLLGYIAALVEPLLTWDSGTPSPEPQGDALHPPYPQERWRERNRTGNGREAMVKTPQSKYRSYWYAIWVDAMPSTGINAVSKWLAELSTDKSSHAAQLFITALVGRYQDSDSGPNLGNFLDAPYLKSLYILMHRHIRAEDDVDLYGGGVVSSKLRGRAQNARDRLFNLLSEIPGKKTYVALAELIKEHPDPIHRPWMIKQAHKRAEQDGDLEPWSAEQVSELTLGLTKTPSTHRQLFDLTVDRLIDLKVWIEQGDTSPYFTWRKVESEREMRNLVAGWLSQNAVNHFSVSQEPELANTQRMDIWLQNQNARYPIPIELKLLDKGWTGPKLCERLRNQLVGDYLRDGTDRCGVMLLVWQGSKAWAEVASRW